MNQTVSTMVEQINQIPERESFRLFSALGASEMVHGEDFVQFKVKGDRDVNKVKVIYDDGQDLYNIEYYKQRGCNIKKVDSISGIFNDQLTNAIWRRVVIV